MKRQEAHWDRDNKPARVALKISALTLPVDVTQGAHGYHATCPMVPGLLATGSTADNAVGNCSAAIKALAKEVLGGAP